MPGSRRAAGAVATASLLLLPVVGGGPGPAAAAPQERAAAQRLFLEGQRLEQEGNVEAALREFDLLVRQFPGDPLAQRALLRSADLLHGRGDVAGAQQAAQRVIDEHPRSGAAAAAFVLQGDLRLATASSPGDLEEAWATFRRVPLLYGRESFPTLAARSEARVRGAEVSLVLGAHDDAAAAFLAAVEDEPPTAWTARARLGFATVLLWSEDWLAAAEIFQRVANGGSDPAQGDGEAAARARRHLTLIHRYYVRPESGQSPWTTARQQSFSGLQLKKPTGIAARGDGRLVLADIGVPAVAVVSPEGAVEARKPYKNAARPWWGLDRRPYVTTPEAIHSPLGREGLAFRAAQGEKSKPLAKLVAAEQGLFGEWYVIDRELGGLAVFTPDLSFRRKVAELEQGEPVDVARDVRGRLFVLDRKAKRVLRFRIDGRLEGGFSGSWRKPEALAVDSLSNVYVLDRGTRTIDVFRAEGTKIATLGPLLPGGIELRSPEDLAVDGSGRLFVTDSKLAWLIVVD